MKTLETLLNELSSEDDKVTFLAGSGDATAKEDGVAAPIVGAQRNDGKLPKAVRLTKNGLPDRRGEHKRPGAFNSIHDTPYEKSPSFDSIIESDYKNDPNALHNPRDPHYELKHEKAEHRWIIYLKAQGHSITEVAQITGYTTISVSNVLRQPWAAKRLVDEMAASGKKGIEYVIQGAARKAVDRLIFETDNMTAPAATRISAADKLLDRCYGKPNQPLTHNVGVDLDSLSDAEIAQRLAELNATRS